jgi:hypothetical protein
MRTDDSQALSLDRQTTNQNNERESKTDYKIEEVAKREETRAREK